jgi:hypothetical protein
MGWMTEGLEFKHIQPPAQKVPGAPSPGVKWQGCEKDRSLPTSAELKKTYRPMSIHPLPDMPSWCNV